MPPRQAPTPSGFLLLGMLLATLGVGCTFVVVGAHTMPVARAMFALVAMLSLVLVEALWWMRPWVTRAVDAWAVACVGALILPALVGEVLGKGGLFPFAFIALAVSLFVALPCAAVRWYVRDRARRIGIAP